MFEENFDGNLSQWRVLTGGSDNKQLQCYQAANLDVSESSLEIKVKRETITGPTTQSNTQPKTFQFSSGAIASGASFSASSGTTKLRFAFRVKLPQGRGMAPAIYSFNNPWPVQGQIILLQAQGDRPNYYETNYHYGPDAGKNLVRDAYGFITTDLSLTDCYHVFETEWSQDELKFYLDGKLVETKTSGGYISKLFGKSHHVVLSLAVDGSVSQNEVQPAVLLVDWVKVYAS